MPTALALVVRGRRVGDQALVGEVRLRVLVRLLGVRRDVLRVGAEERGQGGRGVLGVAVDLAGLQGLQGDRLVAQVEVGADVVARGLQPLGVDLAEDELLGEVLRPDRDLRRRSCRGSTRSARPRRWSSPRRRRRRRRCRRTGLRRRAARTALATGSWCSSRAPLSALQDIPRLRGVAGILCARAGSLQREAPRGQEPLHAGERQLDDEHQQRRPGSPPPARPRRRRRCGWRMKSPSVSSPASGPSVAVAMMLIAAVRTPVMIVGAASGSSTLRTTSNALIPIPRAASTAPRSTWRMPTKALVRIGGMPEHHQGDRQVDQADADEGDHEGDQGELRNRPSGVADRDRQELPLAAVAEHHPDRKREHERHRERQGADLDVPPHQVPDLLEAPDLGTPSDSDSRWLEDELDRARERVHDGRERRAPD